MRKNILRLNFANLRDQISSESRDEKSLAISNRCLDLPIWDSDIFHLFLSVPEKNEVDTSFLLSVLQGRDKEIVVPKVIDKRTLAHYLLTDNTLLTPNSWGIPEPAGGIEIYPEQIDVVFLPLLAFDKKGNRVGYGGGFYDRFLEKCRKDVKTVGLSFFDPVPKIADLHEHDVQMNFCVTPEQIFIF